MKVCYLTEFAQIGLDASCFQQAGICEFHGPCPLCGGRDRFVIYTDRDFPHWNWWCRKCHPNSGWIDELNPSLRQELSPEDKRRFAEENAKRVTEDLKVQIERAKTALSELQDTRVWLRYHEQLDAESRQLWASRGIPDFWQEYWKLGYDPDHVVWARKTEWHTPTLSIPIFTPETWECVNVRHRLLKPPTPGDKYRPEKAGLPASLFVGDPDKPISGKTLVVEGEVKCMVSFITADDPNLQVVGFPGVTPRGELFEQMANCAPVFLCLDPDARGKSNPEKPSAQERAIQAIGKERVRIIELPVKIDDYIVENGLGKDWLQGLMRQARKV
jgi:hypothetical protein